jgi:hypothetical protein
MDQMIDLIQKIKPLDLGKVNSTPINLRHRYLEVFEKLYQVGLVHLDFLLEQNIDSLVHFGNCFINYRPTEVSVRL